MPTSPASDLRPSTPPRRGGNHARRRRVLRWAKRFLLGALAAAIAAAVIYAWLPKPVPVDVAVAHRGALEVEVREDGKTRVDERFVVTAPTSGDLRRVELDAGATVAAGDVIAYIDPPTPVLLDARSRREAAARLDLARARQRRAAVAIERATTARDRAAADARRAQVLADRGAITVVEREQAETTEQLASQDLAAAELERSAATAEVAAARAILDAGSDGDRPPAVVTAPAAGRILRVLRDSAGPIASGTPIVELGDPGKLEVVIDVLSSDAARIEPGMPVWIERWGGDPLRATVKLVEPSAFTRISALGVEEQRVRVIADVDAPPPALGDGFRVAARIITWRGDGVLMVPASAVFRDRERWAVYALRDGRAHLQAVELGHRGRLEVEVVSGLSAGDRVVVHPSDDVRDDTRVAPR